MKKLILPLLALVILVTGASFVQPSPKGWEKLGARVVNYALERDEIPVGANDGTFTRLRFSVTGGSINMHKMEIVYGNGSRDEIPLKHTFTKGSNSRIIDLKGGKRVISKIIFFYDTKNFAKGKAVIQVFGRH